LPENHDVWSYSHGAPGKYTTCMAAASTPIRMAHIVNKNQNVQIDNLMLWNTLSINAKTNSCLLECPDLAVFIHKQVII
jgi:hypothetical protein